MANFSPGSARNPLEMKVAITWRKFQLRHSDIQPGQTAEKNPQIVHVIEMKFQPGLN